MKKNGSKEEKGLYTVLGFYFSEVPCGGNKNGLGWLTKRCQVLATSEKYSEYL